MTKDSAGNAKNRIHVLQQRITMKTSILLLSCFSLAILAASSLHAQTAKVTMRDSASHTQLSNSLRMAQQKDPIRDLGPAIGKVEEDPAKRNASRDLIKDSTILCFRGYLTLVPKRAVLHLPEKLADRFKEQPNIKVQSWQDFYLANRGWIRTVEVTREQAMGLAPLSEDLVETFAKSTSAVVATFKGGPISVLPLKEPEEEPLESESSLPNSKK
jgi:hypothetical protein